MAHELPAPRPEGVSAKALLSLSFPVAMGYVPLGAVFGFLLMQAGAAWWVGPLSSLLVFAGAAQFMAVPMLAAGVPIMPIAVATLIINSRHIFYGLSLLQRMPRNPLAKGYVIWALSDENYSIISALPASAPARQILGVVALNHFWWILGTLIGSVIGAQVGQAYAGIDFALTALFAVLTVEQWRTAGSFTPIVVAALAYFIAIAILPTQALVLSIALSLIAGVVIARREAQAERRREGGA